MTNNIRILISGASPDVTNRNTTLRSYVIEGFVQLLGVDNVRQTPLDYAPEIVKEYKPNFVLCFGSCMPDTVNYSELVNACHGSGSKLVFWLHDDPYEFDYNYKVIDIADFIFTNDRWSMIHYNHDKTFHLPLAASKNTHFRPLNRKKEVDIFFCGVAFPNRIRLVNDLQSVMDKYNSRIFGDGWLENSMQFPKNIRLDNSELPDHYSKSLITLNMGRDFHYANDRYKLDPSTPGPRTFEAAMAGTVQLYFVESLEIEDYYQPGTEILLFNSVAEFGRIVEDLMSDNKKCLEIASAAQSRTIECHTYYHRAKSMMQIINHT